MIIRLINAQDDRISISRVYEESWKCAYKGMLPQEYLDGIPTGHWVQFSNGAAHRTLVMLEDDNIIGTSSYGASRFEDMNGYGEIISLYLLPVYWGNGYGKQLLQAAIDGLVQIGYQTIFLWVLEANMRARRFYERFGFAAGGAYLENDIGGKKVREIQYVFHADKTRAAAAQPPNKL